MWATHLPNMELGCHKFQEIARVLAKVVLRSHRLVERSERERCSRGDDTRLVLDSKD
jgi:hypothetical protein